MGFKMTETCPICNNNTLESGEKVDVGWGTINGVKVSADTCSLCGYEEPSPYIENVLSEEYFRKCWELQIYPWPQIESIEEKGIQRYKYFEEKLESMDFEIDKELNRPIITKEMRKQLDCPFGPFEE